EPIGVSRRVEHFETRPLTLLGSLNSLLWPRRYFPGPLVFSSRSIVCTVAVTSRVNGVWLGRVYSIGTSWRSGLLGSGRGCTSNWAASFWAASTRFGSIA